MAHVVPMQSITRHRNEGYLQEYAEQSRKAEQFNDVYIKAGNNSFPAHRLVLACYSRFFERLFQTPMKEQYEGTVNLDELDGEAVRLLIEYMYVGSITINQDNVFNLLATANFLQMDEVCQFCFDFLEVIISVENWLTILSTLRLFEKDSVLKRLHQFFSENFDNIATSENFKELKFQDLTSIVQNLNQKFVKETSIYDAIKSWIHHDKRNRKTKLCDLLLLIDLQKLPSDFLEDVVATDPLVKNDNECLKTVMSAITKQFKEMRLRKRGSKLISVGGAYGTFALAEVYNHIDTQKSVYPGLPSPAYYSKSLEMNCYIYSIGGSSKFKVDKDITITNKVYRMEINVSEMKWEEVCPMNEVRCQMGAAVFRDCVVVAGGANGKNENDLNTKEEIYIPALNKWQQISKLNQQRVLNELVSCGDCLFAIGGIGMEQSTMASMERLSDLNREWEVVEKMNEPRATFAAVSCAGNIYAIGGVTETSDRKITTLKSVEKYNLIERKWTFVSGMNAERCGHAACVFRGKIFVVGGHDANKQIVKSIECYDPVTDKWLVVGKTEENLAFHSLIAI